MVDAAVLIKMDEFLKDLWSFSQEINELLALLSDQTVQRLEHVVYTVFIETLILFLANILKDSHEIFIFFVEFLLFAQAFFKELCLLGSC